MNSLKRMTVVFLVVLLASVVATANSFDGLNVTDPTWGPSLGSTDYSGTYIAPNMHSFTIHNVVPCAPA